MRKIFAFLSLVALVLTGCAKENFGGKVSENEVTVSFVADMNQDGTKAAIDEDGKGAYADQCRLQIYLNKGEVATLVYDKTKTVTDLKAKFDDITLIKNQTYDFLFWADNAEAAYYNTDNLKAVTLNGDYVGNLDKRDAFFAALVGQTVDASFAKTIKLYRPFAQLNVITNDVQKIKAQVPAASVANVLPNKVAVKFTAPNTFNVLTGEASGSQEFNYEAAVYTNLVATTAELNTLSMDYIFASTTKSLNDIDFKAYNSTPESAITDIVAEFTNIPLQRNWRTNITGSILTNAAVFQVELVPDFLGTHDVTFSAEGSIEAANKALKEGKTQIEIVCPADVTTPVVLPAETNGKDVTINISGVANKAITIQLEDGAQGPANLYLNSDSQDLTVTTPNTHVVLNGGDFATVNAATSATTLVVGKDVKIAALNVTKGNVVIYGKVAAMTRPNGTKAEMYASDRATLINYINWAKAGDIAGLANDIDLAGENWTPLRIDDNRFNATFDGQGYSIKNMKIVSDMPYGAGFFSDMSGIAKNFTIDGADVSNETADKGNIYGIVAGYAYGAVTFENVKVKNSKLHAFGKVGAILGMAADPGNTTTVLKNCSVENTQIIGCYNVANFVGLLQNEIEMTGCTSSNVTKSIGGRYGEETYVTFVNEKVKNETTSKYVISNGKYWKNGTTYYSAFAEYYNDAKYNGNKAKDGTVDGIVVNSLEPIVVYDFDFECDGKKYATLDEAIAATATASDKTVRIINPGEYKVESLNASNCTIEATVEGVVFNHTPGYGARIAGDSNTGVTVKNITWNVGVAMYQYYSGTNLENCTVNGIICTRTDCSFKDCKFVNANDYNFWIYGTAATFDNCEFTCPGGTKGGALNLYHENSTDVKNVVIKDCKFTALETTTKYSALYIKPEATFAVEISNSTANDKFCTGAISGSKIWNVKDNSNKATTVTVDGKLVYANGAMLAISTPAQLQALAAAVNAGSTFSGMTITLDADIDLKDINWTPIGNVNNNFWGTFDGQGYTISNLTIDNSDTGGNAATGLFGWISSATVKNINFTGANIKGHHDVAVVAGYMQSISTCTISGCNVTNSTISCTYGSSDADGDKCGGIVGYAGNSGSYVTYCTVANTTIGAVRDAGQVVGAGKTAQVTGCSATNVTVTGTGANIRNEVIGRLL